MARSHHPFRFRMQTDCKAWIALLSTWFVLSLWQHQPLQADLLVQPDAIVLDRPEASAQILISQSDSNQLILDVTRVAHVEISDPTIASIDSSGLILPRSNGETEIVIRHEGQQQRIPIEVTDMLAPVPVSFRREVIPVLTKARCNSGGCHGKAEGQNGFKLSVFGFNAAEDHAAIVLEGRGRRVALTAPEQSLLIRKGVASVPHGGGQKIQPESYQYDLLARWLAEGARFDQSEESEDQIVAIEVQPEMRNLPVGGAQQLRVVAINSRGDRRCVTSQAEYESNASSIADVSASGLVQGSDIPGEAAILVRYLGHVSVSRITIPRPEIQFDRPPEHNFVDRHVWDKLQRLGIKPSDLSEDAMFLRRVYLDTIGTLPTGEETESFLADERPDKRTRLIASLLQRDEYADHWTMKWLDILRADQLKITPQATVAMQRWLRECFRQNRPFDQFARELLTAQGATTAQGPASFYKILSKPEQASQAISQLLLGVRIECAQCHHHPSERWSQADYVGLAGFFTGVKLKKIPGGGDAVVSLGGSDLPHPRTGVPIPARPLGGETIEFSPQEDRRAALADWVTARENPFFAKSIANRLWAHYFGRGLVEPIDDLRETNPASNEPLLDALAQHLQELDYDLQAFTQTLLQSRAYQLSSRANESNQDDRQNFSHAAFKTLPAEVLLDAISQVTKVPEKFNGWPEGYRAIQVWDNRMPSYFFKIFGRPVRATVCECERSDEPSIAQALHLLNSPEIMSKVSARTGQARSLAESNRTPEQIIEALYLQMLSRYPKPEEQRLMLQAFQGEDRQRAAAVEDIQWALLNSREFILNH